MTDTNREAPYTRVIDHRHFAFGRQPVTYVTCEYPRAWASGDERYDPMNGEMNAALPARP